MALRTRVMGAGKIMVLAVALLATYVLFAGASMRLALKAREVKVPDLTNRTANDAKAIATSLGLTVRVDESRRVDPKIGAGRVLAQEPPKGVIARRQRRLQWRLRAAPRVNMITALDD